MTGGNSQVKHLDRMRLIAERVRKLSSNRENAHIVTGALWDLSDYENRLMSFLVAAPDEAFPVNPIVLDLSLIHI